MARRNQRPVLPTVVKALVRSMKSRYRSCLCSIHFSCSCLTAKTISTVPLFRRKPNWLLETTLSTKCSVILFSKIRVRIFPAILRREMPL